jgi:catechol 2,3-dioxygenase-like lactoylglutathione lyase family enzyme
LTLQVGVTDMDAARGFYDALLGREPGFVAAPEFQEYEVVPGVWLQITTLLEPGQQRRMRFGVEDLHATRRQLLDEGVKVSEVEVLDGAAAYCNFDDPFGNPLGVFQDLQVHPRLS